MNKLLMVLSSAAALSLMANVAAHGGMYRGPGCVTPNPPKPPTTQATGQAERSGAGNTGRPTSPTAPGPTTPGTPNPIPRPNLAIPRGVAVGEDFTRWEFWWGFNKDRFLNVKEHLFRPKSGSSDIFMGPSRRSTPADPLRPTDKDLQESVLPALKRALDTTEQRDITTACLMALAKIGKDHKTFKLLDVMRERLRVRDQEVRETAALAMGITRSVEAIPTLRDLALDNPAGRKLVDRARVDYRTRSFALYGLGLIATKADVKANLYVMQIAQSVLMDKQIADLNVRVAAVHAIGMLNARKQERVRDQALAALDAYYARPAGAGESIIRSHVPPVLARLIAPDSPLAKKYLERYRAELRRTGSDKAPNDIYRSAALAIGQLAPRGPVDKPGPYSEALLHYFKTGKDAQARYFCLMSLAQIGGIANRNELLKVLRRGKKTLERPWAALALGVMSYHDREARRPVDATIGEAILAQFQEVRAPQARSAMAIALGLCRCKDAAGPLRETLTGVQHQDAFAGYLCTGLALMDYRKATKQMDTIVRTAARRPELLRQASLSLGRLGSHEAAGTLLTMLEESTTNLATLGSLSMALSFIGDRRTLAPLAKILRNDDLTPLSRAFAAVALGGIADKELLPWNSGLAANINYRAAVETLAGSATGVLEIY